MGSGWKAFATNSVLTSADVQGYLQDQAVMSFATSAVRGTAITSPSEGMLTYLRDSDTVEVYNGSAWKQMAAIGAGSILQVVSNSSVTNVGNNSTSYTASGESVTITPKSTSSKILLIAAVPYYITGNAAAGNFTLFRGTTSGTDLSGGAAGFGQIYSAAGDVRSAVGMTTLDSPATISATTYITAHRSNSGVITLNSHPSGSKGTLTAIEVAG